VLPASTPAVKPSLGVSKAEESNGNGNGASGAKGGAVKAPVSAGASKSS
jgi:hypothetical protein